jgi:uridine kinase
VKYDRRRIGNAILKATTSVGNANPALAETMSQKVEEALTKTYGSGIPTVEDIQDVVESVLMENRLTRIAHNYIIYRHQRAMARAARAHSFEVTDNVPYRVIYDVLRWNMDHQCESVEALNHIIRKGQFPELVRAADLRYEAEVAAAAERILGNLQKIRVVIIAGPSSSGKTTTTIKIGEQLKKAGISLKALTVDNYFFDLDQHPTDEFGDHDYETPQALDMALINEHLVQLLDGRTIQTPQYSFKEGLRRLNVHEMSLAPNEILLIDSLHGLHESMTSRVEADRKFKLYVETLGQFRMADGTFMRWSDNRLLRRMIRDKDHRNLKPMETLTHWHYVRRSELKSIIPFLKSTDCIVNTALPYELPILRDRLFRCISSGTRMFKSDPRRLDAHIRANRVHELLKPLKVVKDDSCVPDNSLLREFIGGSRYKY